MLKIKCGYIVQQDKKHLKQKQLFFFFFDVLPQRAQSQFEKI